MSIPSQKHRPTVRDIAHARSGDKGPDLMVGVVARERQHYPQLVASLSPEAIATAYGLAPSAVTRYELPAIHAVLIRCEGALGRGVTASTRLDGHGKTLGHRLLALPLAQLSASTRTTSHGETA